MMRALTGGCGLLAAEHAVPARGPGLRLPGSARRPPGHADRHRPGRRGWAERAAVRGGILHVHGS